MNGKVQYHLIVSNTNHDHPNIWWSPCQGAPTRWPQEGPGTCETHPSQPGFADQHRCHLRRWLHWQQSQSSWLVPWEPMRFGRPQGVGDVAIFGFTGTCFWHLQALQLLSQGSVSRAAPFATCRTTGARPVVLNARRGWPTPRHHPRMKKSSWDSQRCHQCHPCCPSAKRWCLPQASRAYWPHSQWLLCGRMKIWSCQFHPLWVPPSWILFPWHQRGAWPLCQWQIQPLGGTICPELSTVEVCFLDHNIEDFVEIQPLSTFVLASILGPRWHLLLAPWPCCCRAIWRWVNTFGKIIPSRPLI